MKVKHEIDFPFSKEQAKKIADQAWALYGEAHKENEPKIAWKSETTADISFSVGGSKIVGQIEIQEARKKMVLSSDLPFSFTFFFPQAVEAIKEAINKITNRR